MNIEVKKVEEGIISIYENETKEKLINAREYYLTIDTSKEICMIKNSDIGIKISYKHYYEDENIAIIKDISKNEYWQVYFKPKAAENIINWFNKNKEELYYEIQYIKNTKKGRKGEIREKGYKIENVCYKIKI